MRRSPTLLAAATTTIALIASGAPAQEPADSPTMTLAEVEAAYQKVGPYISCLNDFSNQVAESRQRYLSWIEKPKQGPTGRERVVYGVYTVRDPAGCADGLAAARDRPPSLPAFEAAGAKYANALGAVHPLLEEADRYYSMEDYKDDRMARGKSLHPRLMEAWTRFEAADDELRTALLSFLDQLEVARLAAVEREHGRNLDFHLLAAMHHAKLLARQVEGQEFARIDLQAVTELLGRYETAYHQLEAYAEANPEEARQLTLLSTVRSEAEEFLLAAKKLQRKRREGGGFDSIFLDSSPELVDGHPAQFLAAYNDLVDAFNRAIR